jgi:hypothetical protein
MSILRDYRPHNISLFYLDKRDMKYCNLNTLLTYARKQV